MRLVGSGFVTTTSATGTAPRLVADTVSVASCPGRIWARLASVVTDTSVPAIVEATAASAGAPVAARHASAAPAAHTRRMTHPRHLSLRSHGTQEAIRKGLISPKLLGVTGG